MADWGLWKYAQALLSGETRESAWNPIIWPFRMVFSWIFALALQATAE